MSSEELRRQLRLSLERAAKYDSVDELERSLTGPERANYLFSSKEERLHFFLDGKVVGYFLGSAYPLQAGRFSYEPYRGAGHAALASLLENGRAARCSFPLKSAEVVILIEQEIFVPGRPDSRWFVEITKVEAPPEVGPVSSA